MRPRPTRTPRLAALLLVVSGAFAVSAAGAAGASLLPQGFFAPKATSLTAKGDATVRADISKMNFGWTSTLDAVVGPDRRGYLLFDVQGLTAPVTRATLSLTVKTGSGVRADIRSTGTGWDEKTVSWATAPAPGSLVASQVLTGGRVTFDVTSAVSGNGRVAFVLQSPRDRITVYSRETGANGPQLTITTAEAALPPVSAGLPALSGTAQSGQTLSTTDGTWNGTTPMTYAYQWLRCDSAGASCAAIGGATSATYAVAGADAGFTLRSRVTATNSAGAASATSGASAVVLAAPAPAPAPAPPADSPRFGISGLTWTLAYESSADFDRDMGIIDSSGAGWLRVDISWATVQRNGPTSYDWAPFDRIVKDARARGLNVLGIIGYTPSWARPSSTSDASTPPKNVLDFAGFAAEVARHYGPMGVRAYEIWNEPNLGGNWKPAADPAGYTQLLKVAYLALKSVDPSITVVSGGLSPATDTSTNRDPRSFVKGMYANGAKGYFDALGHHPYTFPAAPGEAYGWSAWYQMYGGTDNLRGQMVANGDGDKKIWATEFGAPTNGPSGSYVSETTQAQHVTRAYELFKSYGWAGPLFVWSSRDNSTDASSNYNFFGLLRNDFSAKPSFAAYQAAAAAG